MAFKVDLDAAFEADSAAGGALSEINVIPLVDVVLVLLLIFMLTAPMMYKGIDVDLPKAAKSAASAEMEDRMILTLSQDNKIFLNEEAVPPRRVEIKLRALFKNRKDKTLYLKADRNLPYGFVVEVMDRARSAGVEKLGMVTEASAR